MTVADVHTQDITPYFNPSYDLIEEARNSNEGDLLSWALRMGPPKHERAVNTVIMLMCVLILLHNSQTQLVVAVIPCISALDSCINNVHESL